MWRFRHRRLRLRQCHNLAGKLLRWETRVYINICHGGARHAGVAVVTVQIYVTEETLSLFIVDEGAGFDVEKTLVAGASTGLAGIRERADLLGGSLTIDSLVGEGTTIHAEFSIAQASEMEATQESERDAARDARRDTLHDQQQKGGEP
jgi:glucose-6-phosphate-specific signal transduction histidine kinase